MRNNNCGSRHPEIRDYGADPFVFNINHATEMNSNFRTTLWTGENMQLTLMSIPPHGEIGAEIHPHVDQFIRIESGHGKVYFGNCEHSLREVGCVEAGYAIIIPQGMWHNLVNVGRTPLKLYSLYAPPQHPHGTVHRTKADAERDHC